MTSKVGRKPEEKKATKESRLLESPQATVRPQSKNSKSELPSIQRQKTFIVEHSSMLNKETKIAILSIVMMEVGEAAVMQKQRAKGVEADEIDIDLDICSDAEHGKGADVIAQIYNIVRARIESLNKPAGTDTGLGPDQYSPDRRHFGGRVGASETPQSPSKSIKSPSGIVRKSSPTAKSAS